MQASVHPHGSRCAEEDPEQHHAGDWCSGNTDRLAQRKLDAMGYMKSHICFINEPSRMDRLRSNLALAKSLDAVKKIEDEETTKNKKKEEGKLAALLPEAVHTYSAYKKDGTPGIKFTKKHTNSILVLC